MMSILSKAVTKNGHKSDLVALPGVITVQTSAISENFTRMMNLFTQQMTNVAQDGTVRNSRLQSGERPNSYC